MNIIEATREYEAWLADFFSLHSDDLAYKHRRMALRDDAFPFFRATYYRWLRLIPAEPSTPHVHSVGDLHVENYGLWRDADGRLCWGVNDFDEADVLPYTHDLVRLAASVRVARDAGRLKVKFRRACGQILAGYRESLAAGGLPFVLEERHPELRRLAMAGERDPRRFWSELTALLRDPETLVPNDVRQLLMESLPSGVTKAEFRFRPRVGMGSLGKPRFVALAEHAGGWLAREAKAVTPPVSAWLAGRGGDSRIHETVSRAIRSRDPFFRPGEKWIIRRLAPRCSRIELGSLAGVDDVERVLWAMGAEAANVHLGTHDAGSRVLAHLESRPDHWLAESAKAAVAGIESDWEQWKAHYAGTASEKREPRHTIAE